MPTYDTCSTVHSIGNARYISCCCRYIHYHCSYSIPALPFILCLHAGTCVTAAGLASTSCTNGTFSRGCNTGPCAPTAWEVGAWGVCSKTCADRHGAGKQTRSVGCYQYKHSNSSVLVGLSGLAVGLLLGLSVGLPLRLLFGLPSGLASGLDVRTCTSTNALMQPKKTIVHWENFQCTMHL